MDKTNEIHTAPNIGRRFLAGFIDYFIIYTFTLAYLFFFGEQNEDGEYAVNGLPALIPVIFWGLMTIGLETTSGATLGNTIAGLKAIPRCGTNRDLSFNESFRRHLLDIIDMFFFGLVAILIIKNSDHHQRLGDIVAHTIVVKKSALKNIK